MTKDCAVGVEVQVDVSVGVRVGVGVEVQVDVGVGLQVGVGAVVPVGVGVAGDVGVQVESEVGIGVGVGVEDGATVDVGGAAVAVSTGVDVVLVRPAPNANIAVGEALGGGAGIEAWMTGLDSDITVGLVSAVGCGTKADRS